MAYDSPISLLLAYIICTRGSHHDGTDRGCCCTCLCCSFAIFALFLLCIITGAVVVSITVLILLLGWWLPLTCYGKPTDWRDYVCQYLLLAFCWCSANRPPICLRQCCHSTCYEINGSPLGTYNTTILFVLYLYLYYTNHAYHTTSNDLPNCVD